MRLTKLFISFFESEKAGGLILLIGTCISMIIANTSMGSDYVGFWNHPIGGHSLVHWINDGLMATFFLLIGLELEREIYIGELSSPQNAFLPFAGALGGMILPASIYICMNYGTPTQDGAGIPMATDIAFAIGILSLLGNRVPVSLKIFLTALAVIDDLGAIIVIALFYSSGIDFGNLGIAMALFAVLLVLNRMKVHNLIPYIIGGIAMWYFMLNSGIHATITGVMLAFAIPFGKGDNSSASYRLQHFLHKPIAFFVLPIFAIANTCIALGSDWMTGLANAGSLGIIIGLLCGKPIGIFIFTFTASKTRFGKLPTDLNWNHIIGAGFLGGIGFTMSIFISILAFPDDELIDPAKIAIMVASLIAGLTGLVILHYSLKSKSKSHR